MYTRSTKKIRKLGGTVLKIMRRLLSGRFKRRAGLKVGMTIGVRTRPKSSPLSGADTLLLSPSEL